MAVYSGVYQDIYLVAQNTLPLSASGTYIDMYRREPYCNTLFEIKVGLGDDYSLTDVTNQCSFTALSNAQTIQISGNQFVCTQSTSYYLKIKYQGMYTYFSIYLVISLSFPNQEQLYIAKPIAFY